MAVLDSGFNPWDTRKTSQKLRLQKCRAGALPLALESSHHRKEVYTSLLDARDTWPVSALSAGRHLVKKSGTSRLKQAHRLQRSLPVEPRPSLQTTE